MFVVGGGESVADQNVELLRGHRVVAINSSFAAVPFADVLFFGDGRWFARNRRDVLAKFSGHLVTVDNNPKAAGIIGDKEAAARGAQVLRKSREWSDDPGAAFVRRTSTTGAINKEVNAGERLFVLLGIDGTGGHHHAPHPWATRKGWADEQAQDFAAMNAALTGRGVEIFNASPISVYDFWPRADFREFLNGRAAA